jgi:hypothetical protein
MKILRDRDPRQPVAAELVREAVAVVDVPAVDETGAVHAANGAAESIRDIEISNPPENEIARSSRSPDERYRTSCDLLYNH